MTDTFFARKVVIPFDDSDLIVDADDFERTVVFTFMTHATLFAFAEFDVATVTSGTPGEWTQVNPADNTDRFSFTLPAGRELWAGHTSNGETATLGFLVTR
jgi:hypothetical protein